ncbi:hypothetical protein BDZ97DRAFT_1777804 [Flammula alnicola]|nr:hypothetical protein BDZ97DRAFT_1777804 [Flammula alnicola]
MNTLNLANMNIWALVLLLLLSVLWFKTRSADPYGLFHLSLNSCLLKTKLATVTEWLNMGYWKNTRVFPEAARGVSSMKLIAAANLKKGGRVLDVGHGTGESLLLLLSEPSIPQLSHLVGITSLELHHRRSLERVQKRQTEQTTAKATKVKLYHGDAVYDGVSPDHPLRPESQEMFDSILALDCAYHFNTRRLFLEQSFGKLASGGRIALADICFSSAALESRGQSSNLNLEDITADVFPEFVAFLKSRKGGWWVLGWIIDWYTAAGAKFVIISGKKPS